MKIKKIFASLMAVTVLGTAIPVVTLKSPEIAMTANSEFIEYQYEKGYLTYTIIDGTIEIIKCERDVTEVEIPAEINGRKVTSIRDWAFSGCTALTEIIIPESVTNIGFNAFGDTPWLENKRKETPLVIVNGILIDGKTCSGNVVIPKSITSINEYAFSRCTDMTKVTIPDSVTSIGDYAFSECSGLTSITIPDSVTSIGKRAFDKTPWLENKQKKNPLVVVNGILVDGETCSGDVVIPDGVTSICGYAFSYCSEMTSVIIPDSVTYIGVRAFDYCRNLTSLTLSGGVTSIDFGAFSGCESLTSITVPDSVKCIDGQTFSETPWFENKRKENPLVIVNGILIDGKTCSGDVVIPDGVTSICCNAFENCSAMTSLTLSRDITSIGEKAFYGCSGLTEITIPKTVTCIDYYTFRSTQWIKNKQKENPLVIINGILIDGEACSGDVVIPDTVKIIAYGAFECCNDMTSLIIPESVSIIEKNAFNLISDLKEITILNPECEINAYISFSILIKGYSGSTAQKYVEKAGYGYKFASIGEAPVNSPTLGDVTGDNIITGSDATMALVAYTRLSSFLDHGLTDMQFKAADVDEDGIITGSDATLILYYYTLLSSTLQNETIPPMEEWMKKR